jgi:transposase
MTKTTRARYTLEFKREAVRLVEGGQSIAAAARTLGVIEQTLFNWVKAQREGKLIGADSKVVSAEQMEISRLRAELARVKMERDILENRPRGSPRPIWLETRSGPRLRVRWTEAARFLEAFVPVVKTWPRGSCGPSCGGTSCDPV